MPANPDMRPVRTTWDYIDWGWVFVPRLQRQPIPPTGIFDEPCYCLKINNRWVPHFIGVIRALTQDDAWQGDDNAVYEAQQEIEKFLAQFGESMGCRTIFRQNPDDTCQLEYSTDNGETWDLAFDYGLCQSPASLITIENQYQEIFNTWNNATNNTEININAPTLTFISSPGETQEKIDAREQALCAAVKLYVDGFCDTMLKGFDNPLNAASVAATAVSVAGTIVGLITFASGGTVMPLVLALGAGLANLGIGIFDGITEGVLSDEGAREEVACCMFEALANLEPTEANFQTAADNCTDLSLNADKIRERIAAVLNDANSIGDQFHALINLLGETTPQAELGLLPECPCEIPPFASWCKEVDFSGGLNGFTIVSFGGNTYGVVVSGQGIGNNAVNESSIYSQRVYLSRAIDASVITGVDAILNFTKGSYTAGNNWAVAANTLVDNSPDYTTPIRIADTMSTGNDQTIECDYGDPTRNELRVDVRASRMTTSPPNGAILLKKLRVRGTGTIPSQLASLPDCDELCWNWNFVTSENDPDWELLWGSYSAGYNTAPNPTPSSGTYHSEAVIQLPTANALTINSVAVTYDLTKGAFANGSIIALRIALFNESLAMIANNDLTNASASNGTNLIRLANFGTADVRYVVIYFRSAGVTSYPIGSPGTGKIKSIKIRYEGNEIWQNGVPC